MDRRDFDRRMRGWIAESADLNVFKFKDLVQYEVTQFMQALSSEERWRLIDDYEEVILKKRTLIRDRAETMVALHQLRKLEPHYFAGKSPAQGALSSLGPGLDADAQKFLNAEWIVHFMMSAHMDLEVRSRQSAPEQRKPPPPSKGRSNTR